MRFVKPVMGGVEEIVVNSTVIKKTGSDFSKLFGDGAGIPDYDSSKGVGRIKVGSAEFVFLKDEDTGLIVPFYWDGVSKNNAVMAVGVEKTATGYTIKTTRSSAKNDKTLKTSDFTTDVAAEFKKVESQTKFAALYAYNAPNAEPYIKAFIPVSVGGKDGTILVAPHARTGDNALYFVEKPAQEIKNALVTKDDFVTVVGDRKTTGVVTIYQTGNEVEILMADRSEVKGVTCGSDISAGLEAVSTGLGKDKVKSLTAKRDADVKAGLAILGGVDASHIEGFGKKAKTINDCFVVAPHVNGGNAVYIVEGLDVAGIQAKGLTRDEFLTVVTGKAVGGVLTTFDAKSAKKIVAVNGKDVSDFKIAGARTYYPTGGSSVYVKKYGKNWFTYAWGKDLLRTGAGAFARKFTLGKGVNLEAKLNEIAKSNGIEEKIGTYYVKNPRKLGKIGVSPLTLNIGTKHLISVALAAGIVVASIAGAGAVAKTDSAAKDAGNDAYAAAAQLLGGNEKTRIDVRTAALAELPDETEKAKEFGKIQADDNADEIGTLIGRQYTTGDYDTRGLVALYEKNVNGFMAYTQSEESLKYIVTEYVDSDKNGAADKDADGKWIMEEVEYSLSQAEVEAYGKIYEYTEATKEGIWSETGTLAVKAAIDAGMPIGTYNGGEVVMNYPYYGGSREAMVAQDNIGEAATEAFENAFDKGYQDAVDKGTAGSAITNPQDALQDDSVLAAAAKIAGDNAIVFAVQDEQAYVKSADESKLYAVSVSGSLDAGVLASDLYDAYASKDYTVYDQASARLGAISDLDEDALKSKGYGDVYIADNIDTVATTKGTLNRYYATMLTLDGENGTVEQSFGYDVYRSTNINTTRAAAYSVLGANVALDGSNSLNQGYVVGEKHTESEESVSITGIFYDGKGRE